MVEYQHRTLAEGRWKEFSLAEQMANIGSEVGRAINWKKKDSSERFVKAAERALELIDITLKFTSTFPKLKEVARLREVIVDYFFGDNEYSSTDDSLNNYFYQFNYAARKDH